MDEMTECPNGGELADARFPAKTATCPVCLNEARVFLTSEPGRRLRFAGHSWEAR